MKVQIIIIFTLLLCNINGFTQRVNSDSLKQILETNISDKNRIEIYITLSNELRKQDATSAKAYIENAINLSEKIKDKELEAKANLGKLPILAYENKIDEALKLSNKTLTYYESISDTTGLLSCLNALGILYKLQERSEDAAKTYLRGIDIADNNPQIKARLLTNLAIVQKKLGNFVPSIQSSFEALSILKSINDYKGVGLLYNNIGILYRDQGDIKKALKYYKLSLEALKNSSDEIAKLNAYINIGNSYNSMDSIQLGYQSHKNALAIAEKIGYEKYIIIVKSHIALYYAREQQNEKAILLLTELDTLRDKMRTEGLRSFYVTEATIYENKGQYDLALIKMKKALEISEVNAMLKNKATDYYKLSSLYQLSGNYELAYNYYVKHKIINDSLVDQDKLGELRVQQAEYEFHQQQAVQEKMHETEQALAQKTIRLRSIMAFGSIIALILIAGWGFTIYEAKQQDAEYAKQLEVEVAKRTKELEQANYELRTFNYIASHDIKEPIRNIGNYVGLIFRKLPTDLKDNLGEYFDIIKSSTVQLYTLIEDFASYTTMSRTDVVETKTVDLNQLIVGLITNLKESIEKSNGVIYSEDLPIIKSSYSLLFVVLKNLIENGLKYNESENPMVSISYNKTETTEMSGQAYHEITVSDNGIGIEQKYQEKIFEMFKRLHHRGEYEGSGIGLAIVKLSVNKLKGTIEVESEEGKGSRFLVKLPV